MRFVAVVGLLLLAPSVYRAPDLKDLCEEFTGFDFDRDGAPEIVRARVLGGSGTGYPLRVVGFVEERLTDDADLLARLQRWADDLAAEGFGVDLVALTTYQGDRHQDGLTVLALRNMLQVWRAWEPGLAGAVLVGHFPDAYLVRSVNWRKSAPVVLRKGTPEERRFERRRFLRRIPETVAPRCDLVLADLDGPWEERYVLEPTAFPRVVAVFEEDGVPEGGGTALDVEVGETVYRDVFHVADGRCEVDGLEVRLFDDDRDLECTTFDRRAGNPIAQPDIFVSRIDARGVAWSPNLAFEGEPLLDGEGRPREVALASGTKVDVFGDLWQPDPALERRLLNDYFDRNHAYRTEPAGDAYRPASIAHGLPSGMRVLRLADESWASFDEDGYDVKRGAGLDDLLAWFQRPATFRTLRAHSDGRCATFEATDVDRVHGLLGAPPLGWTKKEDRLVPSLAAATRRGRADFFLWRALWEANHAAGAPYLMLHTGCEAISPPGARKHPSADEAYGRWGHGESLLFLTPAVGIVGRAKVFYDEPRGFVPALADGQTVGEAWKRYPETESKADRWSDVGGDIGRKRSYFWSILGDATLTLQKR